MWRCPMASGSGGDSFDSDNIVAACKRGKLRYTALLRQAEALVFVVSVYTIGLASDKRDGMGCDQMLGICASQMLRVKDGRTSESVRRARQEEQSITR